MKSYQFKKLPDYIYYLSEIIIDTAKYKARLERYLQEIDVLLAKNSSAKFIETELYESLSDKTKAVFFYLFNLLGDETKTAISYRKFRKMLLKNSKILGISIPKLTNVEAQTSNSFNKHRNWGLHIPESLLVSKRKFLNVDDDFIMLHCKEVPLPHFQYFEIEYLHQLRKEVASVLLSIDLLENRMHKDYTVLVGGAFRLYPDAMKVKPYRIMEIVKGSHEIQMGKNT